MNEIFAQKRRIRDRIESKRRNLAEDWVRGTSAAIARRVLLLPEIEEARTVHSYVAWGNEVRTHDLIETLLAHGKRLVVPKVDLPHHRLLHGAIRSFDELRPGAFGILEPPEERLVPVDLSEIDAILVPGVAFDLHGHRVGFGGGFYDGFLRQMTVPKIGLAFHFQIVEQIPTRPEDERVNLVVTEQGVFRVQE